MDRGERSCWNCQYHKHTPQDSLIGSCFWFVKKFELPKPIPPEIADKGCKFHMETQKVANETQTSML